MCGLWRFQFGLRTLLLAMLLLGMAPWAVIQFIQWRDDRLWISLQAAKQQRDAALVAWRVAYDAFERDKSPASDKEELEAQQRYYAARNDVESARKAVYARYGDSEKELMQAIAARRRQR
jgi:hypothetical protein